MSARNSPTSTAVDRQKAQAKPKKSRAYIRADSLREALGDDDKRNTVCDWLFGQGINFTLCARQIEEDFGICTSVPAVRFFYQQHAFLWKVGRAKSQAEIEKDALPTDWEASIRQALAQRRFEATFQNLTQQQLLAFEKIDLEKTKVDLKKSEVSFAERRLLLLEKQMADAQETLADSTLSPEDQARRIRRILGAE